MSANVVSFPYKVNKHKDDLINYIIFLRITPFLPNWFINIVSPVIGVPVIPFFIATVIGNHGYTNTIIVYIVAVWMGYYRILSVYSKSCSAANII